jgi:hypothetical protein
MAKPERIMYRFPRNKFSVDRSVCEKLYISFEFSLTNWTWWVLHITDTCTVCNMVDGKCCRTLKQIIISWFFVKKFQRTDTVIFLKNWRTLKIELHGVWPDKGVQKYKRNQCRTELVRGCLAPHKSYLKPQGMGIQSMGPGEAEPRQPLVLRMPESCMRQSPGGPSFWECFLPRVWSCLKES